MMAGGKVRGGVRTVVFLVLSILLAVPTGATAAFAKTVPTAAPTTAVLGGYDPPAKLLATVSTSEATSRPVVPVQSLALTGSRLVTSFAVAAEAGVLATPTVESTKLQNVVNDLYKGTINPNRVGTGTTADAVRNELETGLPTGGTFHLEKAQQYSNALAKLLKSGNLGDRDRLVAQSLLDDLGSAQGGAP